MRADRFTALIDANVLARALPHNVILSLAEDGFYRARWSADILDETERAIGRLLRDRVGEPGALAKIQRERVEAAFPEALVEGYAPLIVGPELPDKKDRHVLAAAIRTAAALIVTDNAKDFPSEVLEQFDIQQIGTDDFVADIIDLDPVGSVSSLRRMRVRFATPAIDAADLVRRMEAAGMTRAADLLLDELPNL